MQRIRNKRLRLAVLPAMAAFLVALAIPTAGVASASTAAKKGLSISSVTIGGSENGDFGQLWIAQQDKLFAKNGLKVTFVPINGLSTAATTAAFLSGAFQFINNAAASTMIARQQGAPIEAIAATNEGQTQDFTISAAAAAKFSIPAAGNNTAQAVKQISAFKGSHITIAATGNTALAYVNAQAVFHQYGITSGTSCTTCDVDWVFGGTTAADIAGFNAGKFQGFVTNPPQSVQGANSTYINMGLIPPVSQATGLYLETTDTMAEQHADTTQAVVNSMVEAWAFAKQHPAAAERMLQSLFAVGDSVTSPDEDQFLYTDLARFWVTPYMVRSAFQAAEKIVNISETPPITLQYNQWCANRFVVSAAKNLNLGGLKVPTTL